MPTPDTYKEEKMKKHTHETVPWKDCQACIDFVQKGIDEMRKPTTNQVLKPTKLVSTPPQDVQGWEERFDKQFQVEYEDDMCGGHIPVTHGAREVKDFICSIITAEVAKDRERIKKWMKGMDCGFCNYHEHMTEIVDDFNNDKREEK